MVFGAKAPPGHGNRLLTSLHPPSSACLPILSISALPSPTHTPSTSTAPKSTPRPLNFQPQELRASQHARAMLGLHDDAAWRALAALLSPGPWCLSPDPRPGPLTAAELCRRADPWAAAAAARSILVDGSRGLPLARVLLCTLQ
jgi:hypothetical protein